MSSIRKTKSKNERALLNETNEKMKKSFSRNKYISLFTCVV